MLSKSELIKLLLFFIRANDTHIVEESTFVSKDICLGNEVSVVQEIMRLLIEMREKFDYSKSPEFENEVLGKSNKFIEMKKKINNKALKKKDNLQRLDDALENLLSSNKIFNLVEYSSHSKINKIIELISSLSNPKQNLI